MVPAPSGSLTEGVVPIEAGAHVTAAAFLDGTPVLALGDGGLLFVGDARKRLEPHPDAGILVAATAGPLW